MIKKHGVSKNKVWVHLKFNFYKYMKSFNRDKRFEFIEYFELQNPLI